MVCSLYIYLNKVYYYYTAQFYNSEKFFCLPLEDCVAAPKLQETPRCRISKN